MRFNSEAGPVHNMRAAMHTRGSARKLEAVTAAEALEFAATARELGLAARRSHMARRRWR